MPWNGLKQQCFNYRIVCLHMAAHLRLLVTALVNLTRFATSRPILTHFIIPNINLSERFEAENQIPWISVNKHSHHTPWYMPSPLHTTPYIRNQNTHSVTSHTLIYRGVEIFKNDRRRGHDFLVKMGLGNPYRGKGGIVY